MKKTLFSLGSLAAIAAPLAAVVACGGSAVGTIDFGGHKVDAISTGGYSGSMTKLAAGDITMTGAWADARFYAGDNADTLKVVGVEKKRISNDGIQVKGSMKGEDQLALQNMFIDLISIANAQKAAYKAETSEANKEAFLKDKTKSSLLFKSDDSGSKGKTLFEVYSHADYKAKGAKDMIGVLNPDNPIGPLKTVSAYNGIEVASSFTESKAEFFSKATKGATSSAEFKTNYVTKKELKIQFIPSNDPTLVGRATNLLRDYLSTAGVDVEITVSDNYDLAAVGLENNTLDVAFLPTGTWIKGAPSSNFIIAGARPTQIATMDLSGTGSTDNFPGAKLPSEGIAVELMNKYGQLYAKDLVGESASSTKPAANADAKTRFLYAASTPSSNEAKILAAVTGLNANSPKLLQDAYESWIYVKDGSAIDKAIVTAAQKDAEDWTLKFDDVSSSIKYGYTSTTSASSFEFPEIWFHNHFK